MSGATCEWCGSDEFVDADETPIGTFNICMDCRHKTCRICKSRGQLDRHHTSYLYDITIDVCKECHRRIHNEDGFYDELKPTVTRAKAKEMGVTHTFP